MTRCFPLQSIRVPGAQVRAYCGLTQRAIRYYEERGLIAPDRDSYNQRLFDAETLDALSLISKLRKAGVSLVDIEALLEITEPAARAEALTRIFEKRRREILQRLQNVDALLQESTLRRPRIAS